MTFDAPSAGRIIDELQSVRVEVADVASEVGSLDSTLRQILSELRKQTRLLEQINRKT